MIAAQWMWEDIEEGHVFSFDKTVSLEDGNTFASLSGDHNPLHTDQEYGAATEFGGTVVHGMHLASYFSALVGMYCPGERCLYLSQTLYFKRPTHHGDTVRVQGTVVRKMDALKILIIKTEVLHSNGDVAVEGEAQVKYR